MKPSQNGEPVQLPGEVRQRVQGAARTAARGGATTGGQQTARLQSPPSSPEQVAPQADAAGAGTRVAVIYFPHGAASLNGEDRQVLRKVADLYDKREGGLRVVGHASSRTATMDMIQHRMVNLDTSMRRAEAVTDALVRYGVPRGEIKVEARADRDPAYHEFMPTGEAGNRRAEIFLGR
jgi:outer membrane protein OmpA-like peptidoglycan-associated protein